MKIKTSELTGAALDWAVTRIEHPEYDPTVWVEYSTEWDYGGPIIERECIELAMYSDQWRAVMLTLDADGPTPLIAAMRCFVASNLGDEVEVPDELKGERRKEMKKWKAQVCVPMWQDMEIQAETAEEAEATMLDLFDMTKAGPGEAYVYDLNEVKGESK